MPDNQFGLGRLWCWYMGERVKGDREEVGGVGRVEVEEEGMKEEEEVGQEEGDV